MAATQMGGCGFWNGLGSTSRGGTCQNLPSQENKPFSQIFGTMRQRLFPHLARLARIDAHAGLLIGGGAAGAEVHTPVRQMIDHGHPFRHPYGVMIRQDHHSEP